MAVFGKSFQDVGNIFKSSWGKSWDDFYNSFDGFDKKLDVTGGKIKAFGGAIGNGLKDVFTKTKDSPLELLSDDKASEILKDFAKNTDLGAEAMQEFNVSLEDPSMKAYLKTVDAGGASLEGYTKFVNESNEALKATSLSSQAAAVGMKALSVAMNMALMAGAVWVLQEVVAQLGHLMNAQAEASETAQELADKTRDSAKEDREKVKSIDELIVKYKELKSSGSLNAESTKEVYSIQDKITELVGTQASNLDLVNGKLDEEIQKLKTISLEQAEQAKESAKAAYNAAVEANEKVSGSESFAFTKGYVYSGEHDRTAEDALKSVKGLYVGDAGLLFDQKTVINFMNSMGDTAEKAEILNQAIDVLKSNALTDSPIYTSLVTMRDEVTGTFDAVQSANDKLIESIAVVSEAKTASSGLAVDSKESFEQYRQVVIDAVTSDELFTGSLEDATAQVDRLLSTSSEFNQYFNSAKQPIEAIAQTTSDVITSFSEMESKLSSVSSALKEFADNGTISASSLSTLSESFGSLSGFDDFISVLSNSSSTMADVESSLTSLIGEYLSASEVLSNVNDKTLGLVTAQLKAIGVTNAEEVAIAALSKAHGKLAAEKLIASAPNFLNMSYAEIQALLLESSASEETAKMVYYLAVQKALVADADLSEMTAQEVGNLLKMAQAAGITGEAFAQLGRKMQLKEMIAGGKLSPGALNSALDELAKEATIPDLPDIDIAIDIDTSRLPGAVSDAKSAANEIKKAFEDAQKSIDNLIKNAMDAEKQRLKGIKQGYQDDLDELKDHYDEERKEIEATGKTEQKRYENDKKALEDKLDAYKKQMDAQKELLRIEKESADYQKTLAAKQKEVADIAADLAVKKLDTSDEGKRKALELEEELKNKQSDLDDYQADHAYDTVIEDIDKEYERYQEVMNGKIAEIEREKEAAQESHEQKLEDLESEHEAERSNIERKMANVEAQMEREGELRKKALDEINTAINSTDYKTSALYQKMLEWNRLYGTGVDEDVIKMWDAAYSTLGNYNNGQMDVYATLKLLSDGMDDFVSATDAATRSMERLADATRASNAEKWKQHNDSMYEDYQAQADINNRKSKGSKGFKTGGEITKARAIATDIDGEPDAVLIKAHVGETVIPNDDPRSAMQIISDFINSDRSVSSLMSNTMGTSFDRLLFNAPVINPMSGFDLSKLERVNNSVGDIKIDYKFDVAGSIDKETLPPLKKLLEMSTEHTMGEIKHELRKGGMGRNMRDYT